MTPNVGVPHRRFRSDGTSSPGRNRNEDANSRLDSEHILIGFNASGACTAAVAPQVDDIYRVESTTEHLPQPSIWVTGEEGAMVIRHTTPRCDAPSLSNNFQSDQRQKAM